MNNFGRRKRGQVGWQRNNESDKTPTAVAVENSKEIMVVTIRRGEISTWCNTVEG